MEKLLAKNPNINIVYTINEPTAAGACAALKAAKKSAIVVSVDGGLPGIENVKSGCIGATSQQYPLLMADLGLQAIYDLVKTGKKPEVTPGKDFFDTGVKLLLMTHKMVLHQKLQIMVLRTLGKSQVFIKA
jgi:fructose transport system substrate-binding protein